MSQENYTIIPLMGVDQSGNVAIAPTPNTFTIGLPANPIATVANNNPQVNLTVPNPSNFVVGQTITIAGVNATVGNIVAGNLNITTTVTAVGTTTISYNAAANANGAATGGGSAVTLSTTFSPSDFKPLERLACSDGTIRMLVKGTVANINGGDFVLVDASGNAQQGTSALVAQGAASAAYTIGFAAYNITYSATTPNFGWIIVNGPAQMNVANATAKGTALFTSATAGQLSNTNGGATFLVLGAMTTVTATAAGPVAGIATNPTIGQTQAGSL